jgi:bifunctional DNase/RNase
VSSNDEVALVVDDDLADPPGLSAVASTSGDVPGVGEGDQIESGDGGPASVPDPQHAPVSSLRMAVVSSVTVDLPNQYPSVTLRELELPGRSLTFSVGMNDGVLLSHALRRIAAPRPLTHELMGSVLSAFDIDLVAVRLVGRQGSLYFAELDLRSQRGRSVQSCRPSDALTLALWQRTTVPILVDERLFDPMNDVDPPGTEASQRPT